MEEPTTSTGRRSSRNIKQKEYQFEDFSDLESSEDERGRKGVNKPKALGKSRTKECPGCNTLLGVATKECIYCDYQFTSRSVLTNQLSASAESQFIRDRFPFEPEREDDGSLKIQAILGRRLKKTGAHRWLRHGHDSSAISAMDAKGDYEYNVKYKNMSYLHVQWLSSSEIEAMHQKSKQTLYRYLTKIDKGDPTAPEETEIDPSFLEVEKILDVREEEVQEVIDEAPPQVQEADLAAAGLQVDEDGADLVREETGPSPVTQTTVTPIKTSVTTAVTASTRTPDVEQKTPDGRQRDSTEVVTGMEGAEGGDESLVAVSPEFIPKTVNQIWQPVERCKRVLFKICEDPYAVSFHDPVDTNIYDDYLDTVSDPICLSDIKAKFERNEYKNQSLGRFAMDMRQIWKNCKIYNLYKSQIWHSAHALSLHFERLFQSWVLSYSDGSISLNDAIGRPWEPFCRACCIDKDENSVILCDHCDSYYHIYCLQPPLPKIPEESWICPRCADWLRRTGAKLLTATAEEEARKATEGACQRTVVLVKKKKYLVKWRGLSYRECTWETAQDLNDDAKISEFHKFNDAPPEEPPLTQAEIGAELSRDRKIQLYPAMKYPSLMKEVEAGIYAQIRSYHFIKWNRIPPDALLKECGMNSYAYVLGHRSTMALPSYLIDKIQKVREVGPELAVGAKDRSGGAVKVEEDMDDADADVEDNVMKRDGDGVVEAKEDDDEDDERDQGHEGVEEEAGDDDQNEIDPKEKIRRYNARRLVRVSGSSEAYDAREAAREAAEIAGPLVRKQTGLNAVDRSLRWYSPPEAEIVRDEVTNIMAGLVYHISKGTPGSYDQGSVRPPVTTYEIEVCVPKGSSGLFMNIGDYKDRVVVLGFRRKPDNSMGPAEASGKIKVGDVLVGINGVYLDQLGFKQIIKLLSVKEFPFIYLRFLRISKEMNLEVILRERLKTPIGYRPVPIRSRYFGVYSIPMSLRQPSDLCWVAEMYVDFQRVVIGQFQTEIDAAKAYDHEMRNHYAGNPVKVEGSTFDSTGVKLENTAPATTQPLPNDVKNGNSPYRLNFKEDGELTPEALALSKSVDRDLALNYNKLQLFSHEFSKNLPKDSFDDDLRLDTRSYDSNDSDSDVGEKQTEKSKKETRDSIPGGGGGGGGGAGSGSDDESAKNSSDSSEFGWEEKDTRDGEWRPKEELDADGPLGRLLRAVNESDFPPVRNDWSNYMLELGMNVIPEDLRVKKVEQIDLVSGSVMRIWESLSAASRTLNIPLRVIQAALSGKVDNGGGYKWRYLKPALGTASADATVENDDDDEEGLKKDEKEGWTKKLYKHSKEYRSGGMLRDYQVDGLNWLLRCWYTKRSSIIADEMGLGKTVQVISFLDHLFEVEGLRGPFLVAVPLSTIEHWKREAEGWSHMSVCLYHDTGGGRDMRDIIREFEWYYKGRSRRLLKFHLLITTYDDLIKDYEELAEVPWRVVVVDEAHRLRNVNSKLLECMRSVVAKGQMSYGYQHRILMTGTPLQNNTNELWTLMNFIEPAKFPDMEKFAARFGSMQTQEQVEQLQRRIAPHMLRRVKEDVAKDIPPKEETIIDVELTTLQKQYYRAIFERNHGYLIQSTKGSIPKLMNIQMELRKCCNHPFLISGVEQAEMEQLELKMEEERAFGNEFPLPGSPLVNGKRINQREFNTRRLMDYVVPSSGKMVLLDKLLPKLLTEKHKVLIFSQMVKMLDIIEEYCEAKHYNCERLDGRVQGNDRQKGIDRFNTSPDSFIFLLSTRAGGVGINLTAADTVIIFDSDWNPQNDVQAMARCHRIGQSKSVTIYRLITRRSFEAEMFDRASKKLGLEQAVLGTRQFGDADMDEAQKSKLDAKELEQLLRQGAYAVLLEDDSADVKEFFEQDIDSLLDQRSRVRVVEGQNQGTESWLNKKKKNKTTKSLFTGESAMEHAEVDVDDPDFWKKVLPDLVTPDIMLARLDEELGTKDGDDDEEDRDEDEQALILEKFWKDLSQMMTGMVDLQRRGQLPDRQKQSCMKLLLRISLRVSIFDPEQCAQAQEWLGVLEGVRNRRVRPDATAPAPLEERKGAPGRGLRGRRSSRGRGRESDRHSAVLSQKGRGRGRGGKMVAQGKIKNKRKSMYDDEDDGEDYDDEILSDEGGLEYHAEEEQDRDYEIEEDFDEFEQLPKKSSAKSNTTKTRQSTGSVGKPPKIKVTDVIGLPKAQKPLKTPSKSAEKKKTSSKKKAKEAALEALESEPLDATGDIDVAAYDESGFPEDDAEADFDPSSSKSKALNAASSDKKRKRGPKKPKPPIALSPQVGVTPKPKKGRKSKIRPLPDFEGEDEAEFDDGAFGGEIEGTANPPQKKRPRASAGKTGSSPKAKKSKSKPVSKMPDFGSDEEDFAGYGNGTVDDVEEPPAKKIKESRADALKRTILQAKRNIIISRDDDDDDDDDSEHGNNDHGVDDDDDLGYDEVPIVKNLQKDTMPSRSRGRKVVNEDDEGDVVRAVVIGSEDDVGDADQDDEEYIA